MPADYIASLDEDQFRRASRWRLVLGKDSQDALSDTSIGGLSAEQLEKDAALAAIYDETENQETKGAPQAGHRTLRH